MAEDVTVPQIFRAFLLIGATSFGGGVVAYLRSSLVEKHRWIDDRTFVECLAIGQTLPGLNATNMSVLVGDRLRGDGGCGRRGHRHVPARVRCSCSRPGSPSGSTATVPSWSRCCTASRPPPPGSSSHSPSRSRRRPSPAPGTCFFVLGTAAAVSLFHFKVLHVLLVVGRAVHLVAPAARRRHGGRMNELPALVRVFAYLSLLTIGGGMAAYPALEHEVVDVHHWLTQQGLVHLYSVGQMAPGPNMMVVASIGEHVAGPAGSLAVVLAFFLPTVLITLRGGPPVGEARALALAQRHPAEGWRRYRWAWCWRARSRWRRERCSTGSPSSSRWWSS